MQQQLTLIRLVFWSFFLHAFEVNAKELGRDHAVQPTTLTPPGPGSLLGSLAGRALEPADLVRGALSLEFALTLPEDRGPSLVSLLPSYTSEHGLSEWGMGWNTGLSIHRARDAGEVQFDLTDNWQSPWGTLVQGEDGAYYPRGNKQYARAIISSKGIRVTIGDGTIFTFSEKDATKGPFGIFAFHLNEVRTLTDRCTTVAYSHNLSGRPYIKESWYGGTGNSSQYHVVFDYDMVPKPLQHWTAGNLFIHDRRIKNIRLQSRDPSSARFTDRMEIDLRYRDSKSGPAFFLVEAQQRFASGETSPPILYQYDFWEETIQTEKTQRSTRLDAYIKWSDKQIGRGGIDPRYVSFFDFNRDGQIDAYLATAQRRALQTDDGWVETPVISATSTGLCSRSANVSYLAPMLARLWPGLDKIFDIRTMPITGGTRLVICSEDGISLHDEILPDQWDLNKRARLADLNGDDVPDFLRLDRDRLRIRFNDSNPTRWDFSKIKEIPLTPTIQPDATWIYDVNGDGIADVIGQTIEGLFVWFGKGRGEFVQKAQFMPLQGTTNFKILDGDEIFFVDANHDGMIDVLLAIDGRIPCLFINSGEGFISTPVEAFKSISSYISNILPYDFSGSGNTEIAFVRGGLGYALSLDKPSTSLMKAVDDGKGNTWKVTYERAKAVSSLRRRAPVLSHLQEIHSGTKSITSTFTYSDPVTHPFLELLGYGSIHMQRGNLDVTSEFYHDDQVQGLPLRESKHDLRAPKLRILSETEYQTSTFQGLPYHRRSRETTRFAGASGAMTHGTEVWYERYANPWCPQEITTLREGRTLAAARELAIVPALLGIPHCLVASETLKGEHDDASLNFAYRIEVTRTDKGLPNSIRSMAGVPLLLQQIDYDPFYRLIAAHTPVQGTTQYVYDAANRLHSITDAIGLELLADRDPLHDGVVALRQSRGTAGTFIREYAYDGQERLAARWNNLSPSSAASPIERWGYHYAEAESPAWLQSRLAQGPGPDSPVRTTATLFSGTGGSLGKAHRVGENYVLTHVQTADRGQGHAETLRRRSARLEPDLTKLNVIALLEGEDLVDETTRSLIGLPLGERQIQQTGIWRDTSHIHKIDGAYLKHCTIVAGAKACIWRDGDDTITRREDEDGHATDYLWDALGRVRRMAFPDGSEHRIEYDEHARLKSSQRTRVACLINDYDPVSGLLSRQIFGDATCLPQRETTFRYDTAGRKVRQHHVDGRRQETFEYFYDGHTPDGEYTPGQLGFQTSVRGPYHTQNSTYAPDGSLLCKATHLNGWRSLVSTFSHHADGSMKSAQHRLLDIKGRELDTIGHSPIYDVDGRDVGMRQQDKLAWEIQHDDRERISRVTLADGSSMETNYDPSSDRIRRTLWSTEEGELESQIDRNARGAPISMDLRFNMDRTRRTFSYDPRGFLTSEAGKAAYTYNPVGRLETLSDLDGERSHHNKKARPYIGDQEDSRDATGRLTQVAGLRLNYGPSGQLESTKGKNLSSRFHYDESGNRLVSIDAQGRRTGYVGEIRIEADSLSMPVRAGGRLLARERAGTLRLLPTDDAETSLRDGASPFALASPFGARASYRDPRELVDFGGQAASDALPFIRMGTRDYDPYRGEFTTPDWLFLQSPELCLQRPHECNLYGYAANSPLQLNDPGGQFAGVAAIAAVEGVSAAWQGAMLLGGAMALHISNTAIVAETLKQALPPEIRQDPMLASRYYSHYEAGTVLGFIILREGTGSPLDQAFKIGFNLDSVDSNPGPQWPPHDGFKNGERNLVSLLSGTRLDRYGRPSGYFMSDAGTSFEARSLPFPEGSYKTYLFEVVAPFLAERGEAAPWFGREGGAVQYRSQMTVQDLWDKGHIKLVDD